MSQIPATVDAVFQELRSEVQWLHAKWAIYRQLFGHSEKRIRLLNEQTSALFHVVQEALYDDVMLAFSRLTDCPQMGGYENLSLERLQKLIEVQGEAALAADLRKRLDDLGRKCQAFRRHRNKRLAHLDLDTRMRGGAVAEVSRQMVEQALEAARGYMNAIERHYCRSETGYQHISIHTGGDALVHLLKSGLRYQKLVDEMAISWADLDESFWKDA